MRRPIFQDSETFAAIKKTNESYSIVNQLSQRTTFRDLNSSETHGTPFVNPPDFIKPTISDQITKERELDNNFSQDDIKSNEVDNFQGSFFNEGRLSKDPRNSINYNSLYQSRHNFQSNTQSQSIVDQIQQNQQFLSPQNQNANQLSHRDSEDVNNAQSIKLNDQNLRLSPPHKKKTSFPSAINSKRGLKYTEASRKSNIFLNELQMTKMMSEDRSINVTRKSNAALEIGLGGKFISKVYYVINFIARMKKFGGIFREGTLNENQKKLIGDASNLGGIVQQNVEKQHQNKLSHSTISLDLKRESNLMRNQSQRSGTLLTLRKHGSSMMIHINSIYKLTRKSTLFQKISEIPTFSPHSKILDIFEIIQVVMSLLCIVYLPIEVAVKETFYNLYGNKWDWFIISSIALFILGLFLNFNRGFYDKGLIVMNRRAIAKLYLQTGFLYDFMSMAPLILSYIGVTGYFQFLNIFVFFRLKNIMQFFWKCNSKFQSNNWTNLIVLLKLIRIILTILLQAHLFACVFLGLVIHQDNNNNWVTRYNNGELLGVSWFNKYVYAFYWAITTMTTVGLGDIAPNNFIETICYTIFMMSATCMFAYYFNAIGMVVQDMNKRNKQFSLEMTKTLRFLQSKQIEPELQQEVRRYLQYKYNAEKNMISLEEEQEILTKLNPEIQQKVLYSANMKIIECCKFLQDNFSNQFISKLAVKVKSQHYLNDQYIYHEGPALDIEESEKKLYFIEKGSVQLLNENQITGKMHYIDVLKRGDIFGQYEFFSDKDYQMTAKTIEPVQLLVIEFSEFIHLIKDFPTDFEQFCMMRDKFQFENKHQLLQIQCQSCGKTDHSVLECEKIHYYPNKELVLLRNNYCEPQIERKQGFNIYSRNIQVNALGQNQIVKESIRDYQEMNGIEQVNEESPFRLKKLVQQLEETVNITPIHQKNNDFGTNRHLILQTQQNSNSNQSRKLGFNNNNNVVSQALDEGERSKYIICDVIEHSNILQKGFTESRRSQSHIQDDPRFNDQYNYYQQKQNQFYKFQANKYITPDSATTNKGSHLQKYNLKRSSNITNIQLMGDQNIKRSQIQDDIQQHHIAISSPLIEDYTFTSLTSNKEEFDLMKEFTTYYPSNNFSLEINKYNSSLKRAQLAYRNHNYHLYIRSKRYADQILFKQSSNQYNSP